AGLVTPRACHAPALTYPREPPPTPGGVVGAGPAGLSAALVASRRGHGVTLFDRAARLGGQLNMARQIPGKEEFHGLVAYYEAAVAEAGITLKLNTDVTPNSLQGFDEVIVATGVTPRDPAIPGQDLPHVLSYIDVLRDRAQVGPRVAIIGAGGIGFDVAEYLAHQGESPTQDLDLWNTEWGVSRPWATRGGLAQAGPQPHPPAREITLLQRKAQKLGKGLGKTTGWIHRASLKMKNVTMIGGVNYEEISEQGLLISTGEARENPTWLQVDNIVLCAGQEPQRHLADQLEGAGHPIHVIGGADVAAELDAKRAIDQGARLAATL
ncbi:MAG: FAD/NAD(P)-binding oxidoreductase, partial [Pseudomonadota bacterium]